MAALRYQHATDDRDSALADALSNMATDSAIREFGPTGESATDERRTKSLEGDEDGATITPLTSHDDEQSQRGSNPCLHLERVVS
jgi:hypothetical protein